MEKQHSFHDFVVHDLLGDIPDITSRKMFSGWGIYKHGTIFAIIADGALYFKVGEENRRDFENAGSQPFTYSTKHRKAVSLSYWLLPEEVMDDKEKLATWIERALHASVQKPQKQQRKTHPRNSIS